MRPLPLATALVTSIFLGCFAFAILVTAQEATPIIESPDSRSVPNQSSSESPESSILQDPEILLYANGDVQGATVQVQQTISFEATGPWAASDANLRYTVRSIDELNCGGDVVVDQSIPTTSVTDGSATFSWTPTAPGYYPVHVWWEPQPGTVWGSFCSFITVTPPELFLYANGDIHGATVQVQQTISFETTGPWAAGDANLRYTVRSIDELNCGGDVVVDQSIPTTSVTDGSATFSWTPTAPGYYPVHVWWEPQPGTGWGSYCSFITVTPPVVELTANGNSGPVSVAPGQLVHFVATGTWGGDETDLFYSVGSPGTDICASDASEGVPLTPSEPGVATFDFTPSTTGEFAFNVHWIYDGSEYASNCVLIRVMIAPPSSTAETTVVPSATASAPDLSTVSPTSGVTPIPSAPATDPVSTEIVPTDTSIQTPDQTPAVGSTTDSQTGAVTSLPDAGVGPSPMQSLLAFGSLLLALMGIFVYVRIRAISTISDNPRSR